MNSHSHFLSTNNFTTNAKFAQIKPAITQQHTTKRGRVREKKKLNRRKICVSFYYTKYGTRNVIASI